MVERMHRGTFHLRGTFGPSEGLNEGRESGRYCFHVYKAPTLTYLVFGDLRMLNAPRGRPRLRERAHKMHKHKLQTCGWVPCSCNGQRFAARARPRYATRYAYAIRKTSVYTKPEAPEAPNLGRSQCVNRPPMPSLGAPGAVNV